MGSFSAPFFRVACDLWDRGHSVEYILEKFEMIACERNIWQDKSKEERDTFWNNIISNVIKADEDEKDPKDHVSRYVGTPILKQPGTRRP